MKNYLIPEQLLKYLISYLNEKPYKESANIISALSQLEQEQKEDNNGNTTPEKK